MLTPEIIQRRWVLQVQRAQRGVEYFLTEGVNDFNIKQKKDWNVCFTIYPQICFSSVEANLSILANIFYTVFLLLLLLLLSLFFSKSLNHFCNHY